MLRLRGSVFTAAVQCRSIKQTHYTEIRGDVQSGNEGSVPGAGGTDDGDLLPGFLGWKREDIIKFMEAMILCGYTAKNLSTLLVDECNKLYGGEPGDDATACVVRVRRRVPMNMLFGPPSNRDDGDRMMSLFFAKEGKHIICGGTTSSIAAKWLNKPLRPSLSFEGDIPPIAQLEDVKPYVDAVITFEELQALLDSRDIDITALPEDLLDNASYFGRIFARSGGLSDAVAEGLKEQKLDEFQLKACTCDGIEECRMALLKKSKNVLDANFIEGMACVNGCIGGAGNLTHGEKNKAAVDSYGREALEKTILDAIAPLK